MKRRIKKDMVLILLGVAIVTIPFLLRMKEQERSNRYMKAFEEEQNEEKQNKKDHKKKDSLVAMPSYKMKQTDEQGKNIYQDICFPVTKEFREKLYGAVRKSFEESKKKQKGGDSKEQTEPSAGRDGWQEARDTPFR